jgi:hypothetical protein
VNVFKECLLLKSVKVEYYYKGSEFCGLPVDKQKLTINCHLHIPLKLILSPFIIL